MSEKDTLFEQTETEVQPEDGVQTLQEGMARAQKLMSECVKYWLRPRAWSTA